MILFFSVWYSLLKGIALLDHDVVVMLARRSGGVGGGTLLLLLQGSDRMRRRFESDGQWKTFPSLDLEEKLLHPWSEIDVCEFLPLQCHLPESCEKTQIKQDARRKLAK